MKKKQFTECLIDKGLISREGLNKALEAHRKKGGSLIELLIESGFVKEPELINALSAYLSIPPVRVLNLNIAKEILGLIPERLARDHQVLPIGKIGDTLTLAMSDPLNILVIDDIKKITKCEVNPIIAPLSEIKEAISTYYLGIHTESIDKIIGGQEAELVIVQEQKKEVNQEGIFRSIEEAPVIKFTNHFLKKAVEEKSSDILIEPLEKASRIRLRIDGVLRESESFSKRIYPFIVSRIKVMCNLDISEHRLPQEGRFRYKLFGHNVDFRVSILPSSLGEKIAIRVLDKSAAYLDLGLLGFEDKVLKDIKQDSLKAHGLFLVCGPTGTGKTTTLYSIINHIYSPEKNIITVEDPIEYQLKGINQVSINPAIDLTFASCLRSILRQDPDIIMIGETRDFATADMTIKSALTGHMVLSTLHTTTSPGAITRLVNMGLEPFLLSSTIVGVLTQRLVRVLCPKCKEKTDLPENILKKYMIPKGIQLYKAKGCDFCQNIGYKGRAALCEYLRIFQEIRTLIDNNSSQAQIKKAARTLGMVTLREDGMLKLTKGITTLEEILKVTEGDEPMKES